MSADGHCAWSRDFWRSWQSPRNLCSLPYSQQPATAVLSHVTVRKVPQRTRDKRHLSVSSAQAIVQFSVVSCLPLPNAFLNNLFSNSLGSSPNSADPVSHPYDMSCKTVVRFILIFRFLNNIW